MARGLSTIFFCHEFVCIISSGSSHAVCRRTHEQKGDVWYCGSINLVFFSAPITKMDRLLGKKSKKSPKYSQRDIFPGVLTNTAVGPLGFRTQLDIAPKGEQNRSYQDLDADWTDSTVALDEESSGSSRIVFQGKTEKGQKPPAPKTSTSGAVDVGDTGHGHSPSSERFRSLLPRLAFMRIPMPFHIREGNSRHWRRRSRAVRTAEPYVSISFSCWLSLDTYQL